MFELFLKFHIIFQKIANIDDWQKHQKYWQNIAHIDLRLKRNKKCIEYTGEYTYKYKMAILFTF